jgi:hypothetical protein
VRLSIGWHGPPTAGVAVLLIEHRRRVADEFNGQAPWRPGINEPVALPSLRPWQGIRAVEQLHPVPLQVLHGGVQIVHVERQVLYPEVARARELLTLVGRVELEQLDVCAFGAAQEPDGLDSATGGHAEPITRGVILRRFTLVEQLAAEYVDEERSRLLYVRHGDADVFYAAQPR